MINLSFPHYALCRYTTIRRVLISSCIVTLMSVNNYYLQLLIQLLSFYYANYATLFIFGVQIYNMLSKALFSTIHLALSFTITEMNPKY